MSATRTSRLTPIPRWFAAFLAAATLAGTAWAGTASTNADPNAGAGVRADATANNSSNTGAAVYKPEVGQAGKDVVWVPTPQALVDAMLDMAGLTADDYLIDLGSGDGRMVISAAKRGARAHGIEYNPDMVAISRRAAESEGVTDRATFAQGDIFESDFSDATVISLFLLPDLNLRLRPLILDMAPGTRVVSNSFDMGDWEPDDKVHVRESDCTTYCRGYKWIVPAKAEGTWMLDNGATLELTQKFQMLDGTLEAEGDSSSISEARMKGREITFDANGVTYTGTVDGDKMEGKTDKGEAWNATRQG